MSEKPVIERIHGGDGHDDNMTAFGDSIYTIKRMYRMKKPNLEYKLQISHNVRKNAELLIFSSEHLKYYSSLKEIARWENWKENDNEWDIIKEMYPDLELIERDLENDYDYGKIRLFNPNHIIESKMLTVDYDGKYYEGWDKK